MPLCHTPFNKIIRTIISDTLSIPSEKKLKRIITSVNFMFSIAIMNPGTRRYVTTQYKLMEAPRDSIYAYQ